MGFLKKIKKSGKVLGKGINNTVKIGGKVIHETTKITRGLHNILQNIPPELILAAI